MWGVEVLEVIGNLCPHRFIPGENVSVIHWIKGWVGPTTDMDAADEKSLALPGNEPWFSNPQPDHQLSEGFLSSLNN